jgi:hypothetical protein
MTRNGEEEEEKSGKIRRVRWKQENTETLSGRV